jgi:hypothetical protein
LADFVAEHGIPERTPIVGIFPLAVRHTVQDLAQRASLATGRLNEVMGQGEGVAGFAGLGHNLRQSEAILRRIATYRASELRNR